MLGLAVGLLIDEIHNLFPMIIVLPVTRAHARKGMVSS